MFESIKQVGPSNGFVYAASLLISLLVHAALVCTLILVPLLFTNVLQVDELLIFAMDPPGPPPPPPPPSPPAKAGPAARQGPIDIKYDAPPKSIPQGIPAPDEEAEVFDPNTIVTGIPGLGGYGKQRATGDDLARILTVAPTHVDPPRKPEKRREPVRVGHLEQSKLIHRVNPVYPVLAVKARVSGTVVVEAMIDEEGTVSTVKALSGHPLLVDAAVEAVKQWKYSPTVLNGEPVPILAIVTVTFKLN
jgi:protein TonB